MSPAYSVHIYTSPRRVNGIRGEGRRFRAAPPACARTAGRSGGKRRESPWGGLARIWEWRRSSSDRKGDAVMKKIGLTTVVAMLMAAPAAFGAEVVKAEGVVV